MLIIQNILWQLVLIGAMILVHELGHFWVARFFDVRVDAFSFGFGPRLFGLLAGTKGLFNGIYWLLVPVIGPLVGGPLGAFTYDWFVTSGLNRKKA